MFLPENAAKYATAHHTSPRRAGEWSRWKNWTNVPGVIARGRRTKRRCARFVGRECHMRMCEACEQEQHDRCGMQTWCDCPCAGEAEDYFERDMRHEEEEE